MKPKTAWGDSNSGSRSPMPPGAVGGMARPSAHSKSGPLPRGNSAAATTSPVDYSRTMSGPAYREKGFDASTSLTNRGIPEYDASRDRNCPFTQTNKFKSHITTVERAASVERKRGVDDKRRQEARERGAAMMAGGVHRNDPGRTMDPGFDDAGTGRPRVPKPSRGRTYPPAVFP